MGYSIRVIDTAADETIRLRQRHMIHGGTYCPDGINEAEMDITYNYAPWYYDLWPEPKNKKKKDDTTPFGQMFGKNDGGIRSLYGKPLKTVIAELTRAVDKLKGDPDDDYWIATEGNARAALFKLKTLCEMADYEQGSDKKLTLSGD